MIDKSEIPTDRPFLAYVRRYGWIVLLPRRDDAVVAGITRPGRIWIKRREVLAVADLPVPPEAVLL